MKNKVIIIAGGTGLIGKALTKGFVKEGATVIVASRNQENGRKFAKEINVLFHPLNISDEDSVSKLITFAHKKFGNIDIFINCSWPKTDDWMTNVEKVSFKSVLKNLEMHLGGYFLCCQKFALYMKKQRHGCIINFSSIQGIVGPNFPIYESTEMTLPPAYPLIKGGIIAMTRYFATYFAPYNIRVNCISPGGVFNHQNPTFVKRYENLTPLGRMAKPEEMVAPTLILASDESSYITGHNLVVDGGWTVW